VGRGGVKETNVYRKKQWNMQYLELWSDGKTMRTVAHKGVQKPVIGSEKKRRQGLNVIGFCARGIDASIRKKCTKWVVLGGRHKQRLRDKFVWGSGHKEERFHRPRIIKKEHRAEWGRGKRGRLGG